MDYTVLVNKDHLIKDSDLPKNLVIVGKMEQPTIPIADGETDDVLMEEKAAKFFLDMMNDFNSTHSNKIAPDSGYRSIDRQKRLLEYYYSIDGEKALTYSAMPRASEHHTGLAIDIVLIVNGEYMDKITGEEKEIKDLISMCYKYGFILRYPKGKENITGFIYEPWHFRFVGLELAQKVHDSGLVLEELI